MATVTLEIPDDLLEQLSPLEEQFPELLRRCLQPTFPGSSWAYVPGDCRSASRSFFYPDFRGNNRGFRVACISTGLCSPLLSCPAAKQLLY